MKNGHEFEFKAIKPSQLKVDRLYQRDINQSRVNKIMQAWNPDIVNEPKVSQRDGGQYYIFDGQHTVSAWQGIYRGTDKPILCKVYRGLTWLEEKELFVQQNGISKDPTTSEKLLAEYNSGNVEVKDMVLAANEAGVKVDFKNSAARYQIIAVGSLFKAYKMLGKSGLTDILSIICECWDGDKVSFSSGFILGMAEFHKQFYRRYSRKGLVGRLSKHSASYYIREARELSGTTQSRFCRMFLKEYNYKRTSRRLGVDDFDYAGVIV